VYASKDNEGNSLNSFCITKIHKKGAECEPHPHLPGQCGVNTEIPYEGEKLGDLKFIEPMKDNLEYFILGY